MQKSMFVNKLYWRCDNETNYELIFFQTRVCRGVTGRVGTCDEEKEKIKLDSSIELKKILLTKTHSFSHFVKVWVWSVGH